MILLMSGDVRIAWGVTGSGTYLRETFDVMLSLKEKYNVKITTFLSEAAEEVIRIYGLSDLLSKISPGGYYEEVITTSNTGKSCVHSGRFNRGQYKLLIVSPATSNTVAKIVYGIADTIVTTIVSQALKGGTPVIILPSDLSTETTIPCRIDRDKCNACMVCIDGCPYKAIDVVEGKPRINLLVCRGCMKCVTICSEGAIKCWERISIKVRRLDLENISKLREIEGIHVISNPREIISKFIALILHD